ncbi:MAG: TRCF domain-containing protein, partial [Thermoguttaceae bacterium]
THRLVSKDVLFHNLGLVIIDEEQRFGVEHKERLKKLRQTVDILTLTATPIPRTLHFSLVGLRDISNLETPPEDRMAVETRLVRYHPELVRSAILRELARGGQAFFVHNRVQDIEEVAHAINKIVPEARIGIGHAQMHENELETVMREFVNHEFDVLVCTTIIESGLDIPNANTIFINRADRFGLSELHQLRGRVGRYKNQAYCYLLIDANQPLTQVAAKRLRAIEEFSQLGAGFNIAMRDLEIRGAGNILGTQQSGHIAVVGYEMYCQFLEGAVRTLKQLPQKSVIEVEIDLPGKSLIPKTYVPNQRMKIDLYRRITRISNEKEFADIQGEIIDRFGKPPREVERLLEHAKIRMAAHRFRIRSVHLEKAVEGDTSVTLGGGYVVLDYVSRKLIEELKSAFLARPEKWQFRITDDMKAYVPIPEKIGKRKIGGPTGDPDAILEFVNKIFG